MPDSSGSSSFASPSFLSLPQIKIATRRPRPLHHSDLSSPAICHPEQFVILSEVNASRKRRIYAAEGSLHPYARSNQDLSSIRICHSDRSRSDSDGEEEEPAFSASTILNL